METLLAPLRELEEFTQLKIAVAQGSTPVNVIGALDAQKCHFIYGLAGEFEFRLIVTHNEIRAKEILEDYHMYDRNVMYYPAKDLIFYSADVHGKAIVKERLKVIKKIAEREPVTVVTTIDAGMDYCLPVGNFCENKITLTEGGVYDLSQIERQLSDMGYENVAQVEREGEFCVRGGILDVFPLTEESPCRIDFWGDEVDTIRSIDVESQRSVENLEEIVIYPAAEIFMTEDRALAGLRKINLAMESGVKELRKQGKQEEAARLRQNVENFRDTFEACRGMVNLESYISYFTGGSGEEDQPVSFFDYFRDGRRLSFLTSQTAAWRGRRLWSTSFGRAWRAVWKRAISCRDRWTFCTLCPAS